YFTLIPVFLVNSEGVNFAMSCIWPLATMATLIVLASLRPDAAVANDVAVTATAMARATTRVVRRGWLRVRCLCMSLPPWGMAGSDVEGSTERPGVGSTRSERLTRLTDGEKITLSRQRCQDRDFAVQSGHSPSFDPQSDLVVRPPSRPVPATNHDGCRRVGGR